MEVDEEGSVRQVKPPQRLLKTGGSMWDPVSRLRSSVRYADISRVKHDLLNSSVASTSHSSSLEVNNQAYSALSSFAVRSSQYICRLDAPDVNLFRISILISDNVAASLYGRAGDERRHEFKVAVSFGPQCQFSVQRFIPGEVDVWSMSRVMNKSCYDVRAAHLDGSSLLLGAASKGILLSDVGSVGGKNLQFLNTGSDVLSVYQHDRFAYTGCRNGSIFCFDKRLDMKESKGCGLFSGRFTQSNASITHLSVMNEWEMLVSTIRGDLEVLDLRFGRNGTPVMKMHGHVNSYRQKLGLAVSPCKSFLVAAGSDHKIRAWSLRTGEPITTPDIHAPTTAPPFSFSFPSPSRQTPNTFLPCVLADRPRPALFADPFPGDVVEMQITSGGVEMSEDAGAGAEGWEREEKERNREMCLWVASGATVYRYWLSRKGLVA
ncbi:hypothetical protein EUX98_g5864 [Antrodiella citrinella]|uniref:Uncharacterized protein n=1 Tax=Antrodiella citrinella TaxID=2447956 RepID=A0A4S4MT10_9APHY|nr:hypothetical protein EUX98_g5864 [Antrodiella citrinella]